MFVKESPDRKKKKNCYFEKLPFLVGKRIEIIFAAFKTGNVNISVIYGVFFSRFVQKLLF